MRDKLPIDWKIVETMLHAYNDGTDIADYLGISADTLTRRCPDEHPDGLSFAELKARCRASTRQRLRAKQITEAMGSEYETTSTEYNTKGQVVKKTTTTHRQQPNTAMLIFLGKNYLGQSDKLDVIHDIPAFAILGDKPEGLDFDLDD